MVGKDAPQQCTPETREAANFWFNSLSQDFRCGNLIPHESLGLQPGCYCAQIRNPDSSEHGANGEPEHAHFLSLELRSALAMSEERLRNFNHAKKSMFAYVAHGDPAKDKLELLRLEVLGPAESNRLFAKQLKGLESVWLPMRVSAPDIERLKAQKLISEKHMGDVLYLSLRSMSLDKELRFCTHRPLVGDASGWPIKGLGGQLGVESTECLAPAEKPLLFSEEDWPEQGVLTEEWGHSLRSISFVDKHTK